MAFAFAWVFAIAFLFSWVFAIAFLFSWVFAKAFAIIALVFAWVFAWVFAPRFAWAFAPRQNQAIFILATHGLQEVQLSWQKSHWDQSSWGIT